MTDADYIWPSYVMPTWTPDFCTGKENETAFEGFAGGDGTPENPFHICTPEQLNRIRVPMLNRHFVLMRDLDLNGMEWLPIGATGTAGPPATPDAPFAGSFDGRGHTIYNLRISAYHTDAGLFGYVGTLDAGAPQPSIHHLRLSQVSIQTGGNTGALVGKNVGGNIHHCESSGSVLGKDKVGGLMGYTTVGISQSGSSASVTGVTSAACTGGLIGQVNSTVPVDMNELYAVGNVSTSTGSAGGLIGCVNNAAYLMTIQNAYAQGNVESTASNGGLLGLLGVYSLTVKNSYASGIVTGGMRGGLTANCQGTYDKCYFDYQITGVTSGCYGGTIAGVTSALTEWMTKDAATAIANFGWDPTIWRFEEGKYPVLFRQPFFNQP